MKLEWQQGPWDHLTYLPDTLSDFQLSAPGLVRLHARYERTNIDAAGSLLINMRLQWKIDGRLNQYGVDCRFSMHELPHIDAPLDYIRESIKGALIDGFAKYVTNGVSND